MRENEEDYHKQLKTVIIEIVGLNQIFENSILLELLSRLEGLDTIETEFEDYRATIFKCISLLRGNLNG